ncbi:MAG: ferredoxin--NADP reductase [Gemmatales bacterium]
MITLSTDTIQSLRQEHYQATLVSKRLLHEDLGIFRVKPDAPLAPHRAGQYTTLGLGAWEPRHLDAVAEVLKPGEESRLIRRQYSISHPILGLNGQLASGVPSELEFYIVFVRGAEGDETVPALTPRLFQLEPGARLFLGEKIIGFYTLDGVKPDDTVLLLSTGTGEAPHNYMLWELLSKGHRGPILAACCVRENRDLGYRQTHETLMQQYPHYQYVPLTTREPGQLRKRYLQDLLTSGELEHLLGHPLQPASTHVFLCGNPRMIGVPVIDRATKAKSYPEPVGLVQLLEERGFVADCKALKVRGNIHFEEYW